MFTTRKKAEEYINLGTLVIKEQVVNTVADVVKTYYGIVGQKELLKAMEGGPDIEMNDEAWEVLLQEARERAGSIRSLLPA